MIAARPMSAASAARPSMRIIPGRNGVSAKTGLVSRDGCVRSTRVPTTSTTAMKAPASPSRVAISPMETPPSFMPVARARISIASTSSMTAAPRMIRAASEVVAPRSESTRDVIPTLVAVRAAARKMLTEVS